MNNISTTIPELVQAVFPIVKMLIIVFLIVYSIISLIAIKQINLMNNTIKSKHNKYLIGIGWFHLIVVLLTLIFTITVL